VDALPQIALTVGGVGHLDSSGRPVESAEPTLVRMHRRNVLGDIFADLDASPDGPTAHTLHESMRAIQREGRGALVYLRPEGQGDALHHRLTAMRRSGIDLDAPDLTSPLGIGAGAIPMHLREYGIGGQILRDLGISRMRLLTNHPKDLPGLDAFGLEIVEHVALPLGTTSR
jgi:3,4-dihydroxy 2-butanone 4-phosphate synthase/GTP cyclohydrolase II